MGRLRTTGLEDQDHLAVIGALASAIVPGLAKTLVPGAAAGLAQGSILQNLQPTPDWLQNAHTQGVSVPNEELDFLPLSEVDFTNGGAGTVDHTDEINSLPQRPFRGERLILQATYITAAGVVRDGLFQIVISPALYVGAVQIGATQGNMPASAFGPTAFGIRMSMPCAGQGTRIYLPFIVRGVGAGDRIVVSGGIFGRAVR